MGKKEKATRAALAQTKAMGDILDSINDEHDVLKALRPQPGTPGETGAKMLAFMWDASRDMARQIAALAKVNAVTDAVQSVEIASNRRRISQDEAIIVGGSPVFPDSIPFGRTTLIETPATPAPPAGWEQYPVSITAGWTAQVRGAAGTGATVAFLQQPTPDTHDSETLFVASTLAGFALHFVTGTGTAGGTLARIVPPAGLVIKPFLANKTAPVGYVVPDPITGGGEAANPLAITTTLDSDSTVLYFNIVASAALTESSDYYVRCGLMQPPSP